MSSIVGAGPGLPPHVVNREFYPPNVLTECPEAVSHPDEFRRSRLPRPLIAKSKKKTDKADVVVLADMHRGGYIAACYVADIKTMGERELVRHRDKTVSRRTGCKNSIHGILLQLNFRTRATRFSTPRIYQVRGLKNYRINDQLALIETFNVLIRRLDHRVDEAVDNNEYAKLIRTIPGFGDFFALVVASTIGNIDRFNSPEAPARTAGWCRRSAARPTRRTTGR